MERRGLNSEEDVGVMKKDTMLVPTNLRLYFRQHGRAKQLQERNGFRMGACYINLNVASTKFIGPSSSSVLTDTRSLNDSYLF
jgi:hypothetical protein